MSIEDKFTYRQLLGLQKIETEKGAKKDWSDVFIEWGLQKTSEIYVGTSYEPKISAVCRTYDLESVKLEEID